MALQYSFKKLPADQRLPAIENVMRKVAEHLERRFPASEGYEHAIVRYEPLDESRVEGLRALVEKGDSRGFCVSVGPADPQIDVIDVTVEPHSRLEGRVWEWMAPLALGAAALAFVGLACFFLWLFLSGQWEFRKIRRKEAIGSTLLGTFVAAGLPLGAGWAFGRVSLILSLGFSGKKSLYAEIEKVIQG